MPVLILLVALVMTLSWSQYQGPVTGRVLDAEGNPVEKAEVSIVSVKTSSIRYDLKTDKNGRFLQVGLTPGYFILTVKKSGFAPASKEIHVGVAAEETFELTLKPMAAALEKTLSEADNLFLRANKLYADQKFVEAGESYEKAVGLDAANWGYRLNLGLSYKKAGKPDEALAAFRKAVELNPESYSANKETGEALARAGQFAEARPFYEKAVSLSPGDPDAHFNLGVCLVNTGESEAALGHFQKTVELKPDYADAYYQMGTILIGQNKAPEAKAALEKFLELAPEHEKAGVAKQLVEFLKK
jgi:tetratricopeptide (TPR) repeat protein